MIINYQFSGVILFDLPFYCRAVCFPVTLPPPRTIVEILYGELLGLK